MIAADIALSRTLAEAVGRHADLELATQALSITTFRYVPPDVRTRLGEATIERYLNDLNTAVLAKLQRGGDVYLSNAVLGGRFALRACVVNFRTTTADIQALVDPAVRAGHELHATMRAALDDATPAKAASRARG